MRIGTNSATDTPERKELRNQFRRLLGESWSDEHVRQHADGNTADGLRLHTLLQEDMGLSALTTPDRHGGLGGGMVEAAIAAEELGAAVAPSRLFAATMAARLLVGSRDSSLARLWERALAEGTPVALLWPGNDPTWDVRRIEAATVRGRTLRGGFDFVPELAGAELLLCPAVRDGQSGLAIVRPNTGDGAVQVRPLRALDPFRPLGNVTLSAQDCEWVAIPHAVELFTETLAAGAVVLAAEMVGAARAGLERMVTYAQQRTQFGKTIGSFQALKHRMVDVLVAWEAARALTYRAADQFDEADRGASAESSEHVPLARMAKAAASDALRISSKESIQVHGGIGFTWENPVHFYLKRWASSARLFGAPNQLRALVYQSAVGATATPDVPLDDLGPRTLADSKP